MLTFLLEKIMDFSGQQSKVGGAWDGLWTQLLHVPDADDSEKPHLLDFY